MVTFPESAGDAAPPPAGGRRTGAREARRHRRWPAIRRRRAAVTFPLVAALGTALVGAVPVGTPTAAGSPVPSSITRLGSGQTLVGGESVVSPHGQYVLTLQRGGNLVETTGSVRVWSLGTSSAGAYAVMQRDGNFVLYTSKGRALWSSGTSNHGGASVTVAGDGHVVVGLDGRRLWQSRTNGGELRPNQVLRPGWSITSSDGLFQLDQQADGNLVEYLHAGTTSLPLWDAGTSGKGAVTTMKSDGNLVVSLAGRTLWRSETAGHQGALLSLGNDADATVNYRGRVLWNTKAATHRTSVVSIATSRVGYLDSPSGTFCNTFSAFWGSGSTCKNVNKSEAWCADFAAWVWWDAGVPFSYSWTTGALNGAAASFYKWGIDHHTWHWASSGYRPQPGDVVVYGLNASHSYADHAAIVVTHGDGAPNVVNGDWWINGNGGVVAANQESTASGTDRVSGYASPVFRGGSVTAAAMKATAATPAAEEVPLSASASSGGTTRNLTAGTVNGAVRGRVAKAGLSQASLHAGVYATGPDGTAHDILTVGRSAGAWTGQLDRVSATGAISPRHTFTDLATSSRWDGDRLVVDLTGVPALSWHGDVP
ncbi:MAG TPA: hypothetical protein VKV06_15555 [Acidimicrobiales bacterium]|nr:hypothetical protein [Acidimicrobiales bacterium]